MDKRVFRGLFLRALRNAADAADTMLAKPAPRSFLIELHAPSSTDHLLTVKQAIDQIYLESDKFYRIIDIAIQKITPNKTIAFVRVSGHPPGPFDQTWDPTTLGPFKQIFADAIEDQRVGAS
jgi:hypothetical protein